MRYLNYSDVALVPNYSELPSRSLANTSVELGGKKFNLPIIPANMKCSIDFKLAEWMANNGYFYILHRFYPYVEIVEWIRNTKIPCISISIGVSKEDYALAKILSYKVSKKIDYITIDIAHGHCKSMKKMIDFLRYVFPSDRQPFIIAGNVATQKAVIDLKKWGANAAKVGIGNGKSCTTKTETGFTVPMFSCILDCFDSADGNFPIIADGGVEQNGDIAKALSAGAKMVMAGASFAACEDSPAEDEESEFSIDPFSSQHKTGFKKYYGSASYQNGNNKNIEGTCKRLECNNLTYEQKFEQIKQALQSSISYAGGKDLSALERGKVKWVEV